jgi:hypothetical protein
MSPFSELVAIPEDLPALFLLDYLISAYRVSPCKQCKNIVAIGKCTLSPRKIE